LKVESRKSKVCEVLKSVRSGEEAFSGGIDFSDRDWVIAKDSSFQVGSTIVCQQRQKTKDKRQKTKDKRQKTKDKSRKSKVES